MIREHGREPAPEPGQDQFPFSNVSRRALNTMLGFATMMVLDVALG